MSKFESIKGHLVALRALEIAACGGHNILLYGPRNVGKHTLQRAGYEIGILPARIAIADSCPCGNFDSMRACTCDNRRSERWQARLRRRAKEYDILIECCEVPYKEMNAPLRVGDLARVKERIRTAWNFRIPLRPMDLAGAAERTREMVVRRFGMQVGEVGRMMAVSRTIANMDQSHLIEAKHLAEAAQYRSILR